MADDIRTDSSPHRRIPVGVDDFRQLREECYFVDKTRFIKELVDERSNVTLITRPRRFGKTLTMSMLYYFFTNENADENCNLTGTMDDVDDDLKAFLDYVAGKQVSHPMVDELDTVVQKVKHNKDWRSEYMRYEHELAAREHLAREDGRKQGLEDGHEEGKMEMVLEMLRENQPLAFISKISKYSIDKIAEIGKLNGLPLTK